MGVLNNLDPDRQLKRIKKQKEHDKKKCIESKKVLSRSADYNGQYLRTKAFRRLNAAICL
jgi:hypothetical protein